MIILHCCGLLYFYFLTIEKRVYLEYQNIGMNWWFNEIWNFWVASFYKLIEAFISHYYIVILFFLEISMFSVNFYIKLTIIHTNQFTLDFVKKTCIVYYVHTELFRIRFPFKMSLFFSFKNYRNYCTRMFIKIWIWHAENLRWIIFPADVI